MKEQMKELYVEGLADYNGHRHAVYAVMHGLKRCLMWYWQARQSSLEKCVADGRPCGWLWEGDRTVIVMRDHQNAAVVKGTEACQ